MPSHDALTRAEYETEVDVTLAESFPASDPPSWTLGASPWMALAEPTAAAAPMAAAPIAPAVDVAAREGTN
jgi:hypothetical protein